MTRHSLRGTSETNALNERRVPARGESSLNHLAVHPANIGPQFAHHALQGGAFAFQLEHAPEQIGRGSQRPRVRGILEAKTHPRLVALAPLDPGAANLFLVREI